MLGEVNEHHNETRWGHWEVLLEEPGFKVKKLVLKPGKSISLQYHNHRSESWAVVGGLGELTIGNTIMFIQTDDSVHIPKGATHKVENNGTDNLVIIETQIGDICEESDIVRLEEIKE
jgi:mannose-6-phosphate isomerase-like protein (cupin superfamily)